MASTDGLCKPEDLVLQLLLLFLLLLLLCGKEKLVY